MIIENHKIPNYEKQEAVRLLIMFFLLVFLSIFILVRFGQLENRIIELEEKSYSFEILVETIELHKKLIDGNWQLSSDLVDDLYRYYDIKQFQIEAIWERLAELER